MLQMWGSSCLSMSSMVALWGRSQVQRAEIQSMGKQGSTTSVFRNCSKQVWVKGLRSDVRNLVRKPGRWSSVSWPLKVWRGMEMNRLHLGGSGDRRGRTMGIIPGWGLCREGWQFKARKWGHPCGRWQLCTEVKRHNAQREVRATS